MFNTSVDASTASGQHQMQDDVTTICREINAKMIATERSPAMARMILHRLYKNPHIDLCGIYPPPPQQIYQESPFYQLHQLLGGNSMFFETVLEDDHLCAELWDAILHQCDVSGAPTEAAKDSILFTLLAQYVTKMLPCDENIQHSMRVDHTPKSTHTTIRTPLQLFRANSPLVNRISMEDRSHQMITSTNVSFQPRLVQHFCSLVSKSCTTAQFTNTNKLLLSRYLLKQFHVFCQHSTGDPDVDIWKMDLMADAPFKRQLFEFFKSCISQVPTTWVFRDVSMCWLTYCRPWRYHNMSNPTDFSTAAKYRLFFERNIEFYEVILGKIIKRFAAFEMTEELLGTMRAVVEFAWKEPQTLLLRHVGLDIQPHVHELLKQMQMVVKMKRIVVEAEKVANSGFFMSLFSSGESQHSISNRRIIAELLNLMKDSDQYIGTHLLFDMEENEDGGHKNASERNTPLLYETPKSSLGLPDFYIDDATNHMLLTPHGQKQVVNRERRFDFSQCAKDDWKAPVRGHECTVAVKILTALAAKLNEFSVVKELGGQYAQEGAAGALARRIMYPPVPNFDPKVQPVPAHAARIYRTPPVLRLRFFASYQVLSFFVWLGLSFHYGLFFVIVSAIIVSLLLCVLFLVDYDSSTQY